MPLSDIGIIVAIVLGIFGAVFGAFNYFKKPQEDMERKQAISEKEIDNRAHVLAEQLKWEKESNDKRFAELSKSLSDSICLNQNHTHTIDIKIDDLRACVNQMNLSMSMEITKLTTIINERLPIKK